MSVMERMGRKREVGQMKCIEPQKGTGPEVVGPWSLLWVSRRCASSGAAGGNSALDRRDTNAREALAVPGALLERLLGPELLDRELLAQDDGFDDLGGHRRPADVRLADAGLTLTLPDHKHPVKGHGLS